MPAVLQTAVRRTNTQSSDDSEGDERQPPPPGLYSDPDLAPNGGVADGIERATAAIDDRICCDASQALLTRQTRHRTARTRVPMNDSKGVAFYASGNIASEALRLYSTDLWTEAYTAKAVRGDVQRM